ncbi:hypothetical protein [Streptomyces sp. NPDC007205]|uniref:hypothetical protein n=1 Tax=Streptomyces sp. NPDC007205 TaxID=3154316 RepID=UPI0033CAA2B3
MDDGQTARFFVDQSGMNILNWQKERQDAERKRLGPAWVDHDLVYARDGFKLDRGRRADTGPGEDLGALAHPAHLAEAP